MNLSILEQILVNNFPKIGLSLAFGYGSKVVKQGPATKTTDLIDIIFAVDEPLFWHKSNLDSNSQHYSALKYLPNSAETITNIQENFGARVYFNPYVQIGCLSVKYGVIKTSHLIEDLNDWTHLYTAGRLHKPVEFIVNSSDKNEILRTALRRNKESAVRIALLLLPETFDIKTLYRTITSLSYNGDVRMLFAEDKNKVNNIVTNQLERFDKLYLPLIKLSAIFRDHVHWNESTGSFVQDLSPKTVIKSLRAAPRQLKFEFCNNHSKQAKTLETNAILYSLSRSIHLNTIVASALKSIVFRSTLPQTAKGLLTAGLTKSLIYTHKKITKFIL